MENLKYRHLHWVVACGTFNDIDKTATNLIEISVVADDETSAIDLAKSIVVREDYRPVRVQECFTPHDRDADIKKVIDAMKDLSKEEK